MQHEPVICVRNDPIAQELVHAPLLARLADDGRDGFPRVIPNRPRQRCGAGDTAAGDTDD
jgi:hypothetical protein